MLPSKTILPLTWTDAPWEAGQGHGQPNNRQALAGSCLDGAQGTSLRAACLHLNSQLNQTTTHAEGLPTATLTLRPAASDAAAVFCSLLASGSVQDAISDRIK